MSHTPLHTILAWWAARDAMGGFATAAALFPGWTPKASCRASEDETDDRVVFCNPKNNDGELVTRTAWHRTSEGFEEAVGFDWEEFENPSSDKKGVTLDDLRELFEGGAKSMELAGQSWSHGHRRSKQADRLRFTE